MTALLYPYSPEWRDLALAFCEARDAAIDPPPVEAGLPDDQSPNRVVGHAPGSSASPNGPGPGATSFSVALDEDATSSNGAPQ